jgi:cytochrome c553
MAESHPSTPPQSHDGSSSRMSPTGFGALLTFLVLNLVILGYAVHTTDPAAHDGAVATQAPSPASNQGDAIVVPKQAITQVDLPTNERVDRAWLEHCAACHGIDGSWGRPSGGAVVPASARLQEQPAALRVDRRQSVRRVDRHRGHDRARRRSLGDAGIPRRAVGVRKSPGLRARCSICAAKRSRRPRRSWISVRVLRSRRS